MRRQGRWRGHHLVRLHNAGRQASGRESLRQKVLHRQPESSITQQVLEARQVCRGRSLWRQLEALLYPVLPVPLHMGRTEGPEPWCVVE